jgi:hypothetical protein
MQNRVSKGLEKLEVYDLSIPPTLVVKSYMNMLAYHNILGFTMAQGK